MSWLMKIPALWFVLLPLLFLFKTDAGEYDTDWKAFIQTIDKEYPFFELKGIKGDWNREKGKLEKRVRACKKDEEFLLIVNDAIKCLRDGHAGIQKSRVNFPEPPLEYSLPLSLMPARNGQVVVMDCAPALSEELKPGTVITSINGKPARKVLDDLTKDSWNSGGYFSSPRRAGLFVYRQPLKSEKQGNHKIVYKVNGRDKQLVLKNDHPVRGWSHTYSLPPDLIKSEGDCYYTKLPSGVGYIYLRRIRGEQTTAGMQRALKGHPDAKGWIIDLRGNGGGGYGKDLQMVFPDKSQPLAVIIDAGCISAGETLVRDLKNISGARLFGSATAGSSSSKRTWEFPSGIATVIFSTRSRTGLGNKPIEFNGIAPDVEVEADPEDVAAGKNTQIIAAEQYLLNKVK